MTANSIARLGKGRAVFSIMMLYAGKTSGILVNLVFLPLYSVALGPEGFGVVAVILSLQALLMMLDLGMATVVGRDIAANESSPDELLREVFSAELGLIIFYSGLMFVLVALTLAGVRFGVSPFSALALVVVFLLLVLQNLHYNAIMARRSYTVASALQVLGNLVRAGGTAFVLTYISPTLLAFVLSQLVGAVFQVVASRQLCIREFKRDPLYRITDARSEIFQRTLALLRRARPLVLLAIAGAAVTQLDKPIISFFMSPSSVAPYFLAMTFSAFPTAILASPVVQYFQPKLIQAVAQGDDAASKLVVRNFTLVLGAVVILPCLLVWTFLTPIIGFWLHGSEMSAVVAEYSKILLPAFGLGSLFFVPVILLLAVQDFRYQAISSMIMTAFTLMFVSYYASVSRIDFVVMVYLFYFVAASVSVIGRCFILPKTKRLAVVCVRNLIMLCGGLLLASGSVMLFLW